MNRKERRERNVHFQLTEMSVENETFIFNEQKRTQITKRSFKMNVNERRERNIHLKLTEMNVRTKRSFKKNGCPTLPFTSQYHRAKVDFFGPEPKF